MTAKIESALDVLSSGQPDEVKALREEIAQLDFGLKTIIDAGLPPNEFGFFKGIKQAAEAALAIIDAPRK
ncbi:MAG: hypothetical protein LBU12_09170 [Deltaproteobacteria bacterium]|jgi:hypothetical protein|nr:hypothetical protein [Deltaproteobacteria bacterium]